MQHVRQQLGRWALALLPLLACGSGDGRAPPPAGLDDDPSPPSQLHDQTAVDPCSSPATGCPCEEEGVELDCGTVTEHRGDYLICYPGVRTCADGAWGECTPDTTNGVVKPADQAPSAN